MSKKYFTDESLNTLVSEIKGYTDEAVSTKADSGHTHDGRYYTESEIDSKVSTLNTAIDGKANSSHSHSAATTSAAGFMSKDDKTKLNGIATGAEVNQNAFSNVVVGSTTIAADSKTDSLTIAAGTGISVSGDATNDKVTITNSGVRSISTGTANGTISVNTNGTSANVAVKGLGSAAYTASTAYDAAGTAQTKADAALASAKTYADGIKNDLLNGAGEAYDTLKELGELIDVNVDAIDALETVAASKANASDLTSHTGNKSNPHGVTLAQLGVTATAAELNIMDGVTATAAEINKLDGLTATTAELNYVDGVTSGIQAQLDGKAASGHTHTYSDVGAAPASHSHSSYVNQNAFSNITVGSTTIAADSTTDTLTLVAGSNVTITPDATNDKITIAATDTTYSAAGSALGLVKSGGDVTISSGVITVNDDSHAHVISNVDGLQAALDGKSASTHTHSYAGSSSVGGAATSANKINTDAGSATQPVYFANGVPVATTYTLSKSVPSDAKFTDTTYSAATTSAAGLMSAADKAKMGYTNVAYGTCSTAAATAAKVITVSGNTNWSLTAGSRITVKFTETNTASNPTFNVNGTGAKSVWYNTAVITTSNLSYAGYKDRPMEFVYDGTQYVFVGWSVDSNTTYTNVKLGHGYATCSTAEATAAKVGTLSSYTLTTGGIVAVKFTYAVPASATLNINSKGAKAIYHRGAAIKAGVIKAGDTATFIYNGSQYHLLSVDRDDDTTITVDAALSSSSTNPVQNKVINTALAGKSDIGHTHDIETFGFGTGSCETAAATAAKTVTLPNFTPNDGGIVSVKFSYNVPANATLNINSTGAKDIYYNGAKIIAGQINAGDIATFGYDGTSYHVLSVDNLLDKINSKADSSHTHSTYVPTTRTINSKALSANISLTASDVGAAASSHTHNYAGSASAGGAANSSVSDTPITTAGTGSAYTATVAGITALTAGVSFIMVPNVVSASTTPTLNVNSLGEKQIRRRLSNLATSAQAGYTTTWLAAGKPFRVTYDGSYWIAEGLEKPVSADLYGAVPIDKGGTGATTAAAALTALGAAAAVHNHQNESINPASVELRGADTHGGYIDFHYGASTDDYTTRLIEETSGLVRCTGNFKVLSPGPTVNAVRNIFANTSTPTIASAEGTIRLVYE